MSDRDRARYLWIRTDHDRFVDALFEWAEDGDYMPEALDAIIDRRMDHECRVCGTPCPSADYRCSAWDCPEVKPKKPAWTKLAMAGMPLLKKLTDPTVSASDERENGKTNRAVSSPSPWSDEALDRVIGQMYPPPSQVNEMENKDG